MKLNDFDLKYYYCVIRFTISSIHSDTTTGSLLLEKGGMVHLDHCDNDESLREYLKKQDPNANDDSINIIIRNTK